MPTLMRQINVISRCAGIYRTDQLRGTDLHACHHSYILTICRHPGISQEELSHHIYINKSNVTRHLAYLETHDYVFRSQSETDKRVMLVYPTQKMLDVFPEVKRITGEWNEYLTAEFSDQELNQFRSMLDRISDRAKKYVDDKEEQKICE